VTTAALMKRFFNGQDANARFLAPQPDGSKAALIARLVLERV